MKIMTEQALSAWQRVKELHARAQSAALTTEELAHLHAELRHATQRFRRAYAEDEARQLALVSPLRVGRRAV